MRNLLLLIRSVITGATNTKLFAIEIVLDSIHFKLFAMLLAIIRSSFNTILLYHLLSIWNFLILAYTIYILAPLNIDGGTWIQSGKKRITGITSVLDEFHLQKYLLKMPGHLKDSVDNHKRTL